MTLVAGPRGLMALFFAGRGGLFDEHNCQADAFGDAVAQLDEYFDGRRADFSLTLDLGNGTQFQQCVWKQLLRVPYANTSSYTELAHAIGRPDRVRAVAADGALTGYLGGLRRKRALLDLEAHATAGLSLEPVLHQLTLT